MRPELKADNLIAMSEPIVWTRRDAQYPTTSYSSTAGVAFTEIVGIDNLSANYFKVCYHIRGNFVIMMDDITSKIFLMQRNDISKETSSWNQREC